MKLIHLRFRLLDGSTDLLPPHNFLFHRDAVMLRGYMEQIVAELSASLSWDRQRVRALYILLFTGLMRLREPRSEGASVFNDSQRQKILWLAQEKISGRLEPDDLAQALGISHDYFSRVFRRTFGVAPRSWLMRERIRAAALRLSETTLSIKDVAHQFGYGDVFLFSRQFKKVMGEAPRSYVRKRRCALHLSGNLLRRICLPNVLIRM
jgi:AraC-like DNA-binding protein